MNDERMEVLLRQGAVLKAPAGLLDSLVADIRLPRGEGARVSWSAPVPWFKRWLPAMSFAVIFLGCLVALAVQTNLLGKLTHDNESLRAGAQSLEALRASDAEYKRLSAENAELGRLRKDGEELKQLRAEVAQMGSQVQALAILRGENKRLKADAMMAASNGASAGEFSAEEKAKAERIKCVNNLKQIGLAMRIWEQDHNHAAPADFILMTNELNSWKVLQCPSDAAHTLTSWADVAAGNEGYVYLTPGIAEDEDPNTVTVECPVHHSVLLLDGSVQMLSAEAYQTKLKMVNGRKVMAR